MSTRIMRFVAECSPQEKEELLVEVVRGLAEQHEGELTIPIRQGDRLLGYFVGLEGTRPALCDLPNAEVEAEVQRRLKSTEPRLTAEAFFELLEKR